MDQGLEFAQTAADAAAPGAPQAGRQPPALDLDRLVWDPEYREAMRPHLNGAP